MGNGMNLAQQQVALACDEPQGDIIMWHASQDRSVLSHNPSDSQHTPLCWLYTTHRTRQWLYATMPEHSPAAGVLGLRQRSDLLTPPQQHKEPYQMTESCPVCARRKRCESRCCHGSLSPLLILYENTGALAAILPENIIVLHACTEWYFYSTDIKWWALWLKSLPH